MLAPWKESYDKPRQHYIKQRHPFADKGPHSQSCGFSSSHVRMWELDHKEGGALKNWCFRIVALEKALVGLLGSKEIKPVNPKGNESWIFTGRTDAEAEAPILWPHDGKNWLIGGKHKKPKNLILGNTVDKRRRGWWRKRWLDSITNSVDMNLSIFREIVKGMEAWHAAVHGVTRVKHDLVSEQKNECVYVFIHKIHLNPQNQLPYPFL